MMQLPLQVHVPELVVLTGPMFSGKSSELIRQMRLAGHARLNVITFKPSRDNRVKEAMIDTHDGGLFKVTVINKAREIYDYVSKTLEPGSHVWVAFDEVQLFEDIAEAYQVIIELVESGRRVLVAGLDNDFLGVPFELIKLLMPYAQVVTKMHSVCEVCGSFNGSRSQRLSEGTQRILVGGKKDYSARCLLHFDPLNKKTRTDEPWLKKPAP